MRFRYFHCWDLFKMALPFYLNLFHLSLGDINALYCRAEDPRMKSFLRWKDEGEKPFGAQDEKTVYVHSF